jgi:predicted TIM-barrel fold metal-dependent hydrolase
LVSPDVDALARALDAGCVGLQLPADVLGDQAGYDRVGPLLALLERRDAPLFVHPGPHPAPPAGSPDWWPAVSTYVHQMHDAWYAFAAFGRPRHPKLRICFALLAGLAPLHGERLAARGGGFRPFGGRIDPDVFVETSSYGPRAIDATARVLGVDVIVLGSDLPYATYSDPGLGDAFAHALASSNPKRLLTGK